MRRKDGRAEGWEREREEVLSSAWYMAWPMVVTP